MSCNFLMLYIIFGASVTENQNCPYIYNSFETYNDNIFIDTDKTITLKYC